MKLASFSPIKLKSLNCQKIKFNNNLNFSKVSFLGNDKFEVSKDSKIGTVNHQTCFFREEQTDEFVQNYIREHFANKPQINIVSGACSTGEEVYSYACMLDNLGTRINISGFDIDEGVLEDAQEGKFNVKKYNPTEEITTRLEAEGFLLDDNEDELSSYQKQCKEKFLEYFSTLSKKETQEIDKGYEKALKDLTPEAIEEAIPATIEMYKAMGFDYYSEDDIREMLYAQKEVLEQKVKEPKETFLVQKFKFNKNLAKNSALNFEKGDVLNIDRMFKENSQDILLYRNALYHTLCQGNNLFRAMNEGAKETMSIVAKKMNKVLVQNGLVVFGENESLQGIDKQVIYDVMKKNGFEPVVTKKLRVMSDNPQDDWNSINVWKKVSEAL